MNTQLSIANRALLAIGARAQISSLNPSDGSVEGDAVSTLWQPTFEALARTARWNCLKRQITLTLLQAAKGTPENPDGSTLPLPPTPWLYAYEYPSDCLQVQAIWPFLTSPTGDNIPQTTINNTSAPWFPQQGQIPYQIQTSFNQFGQPSLVILTNQSQAQGIYTVNQSNPALWDSLFQADMVASLGAFLVPALSLNLSLLKIQIATADKAIAIARATDGNEGVTTMDHLPDWMIARLGGGSFATSWNAALDWYTPMAWPTVENL